MTITVSTDGSALGNPNGPMGWAWADHELNMAHSGGHEHGRRRHERHESDRRIVRSAGGAARTSRRGAAGHRDRLAVRHQLFHQVGARVEEERLEELAEEAREERGAHQGDRRRAVAPRRLGEVRVGHAGNAGNEKVDDLARTYAGDCRSGVQEGYLPKEGWQSLLASEYAKGTDVPEDAQMLLDGKISTQEYHLGRGGESGEAGAEHESDGDNVAKRIRKPSLAELLAEPEGVPDYGETQSDTSSTTAMSAPAVPMTTESDTTVALPSNSAQAEDTQSGSSTRSVAEPAAPRLSPTALTASGTLRFTPPPSTSPTYDGRPRIIHGLVRVDGYVNGDGTITLDNAAFYTDKQG